MSPPSFPESRAIQLVRWLRTPTQFLDEAAARFGDVFRLRVPGFDVVVTSQPDVVKEMFTMTADQAHAGKANAVLRPFVGEHSVLVLDGKEHHRHRKMMMPAFHGERMQAYGRAMLEAAHASIDGWPEGRAFPVHERTQAVTLDVIVRTVFGIERGPRFAELERHLARTLDLGAWPPLLVPQMQRDLGPWSPWGKFQRSSARVSEILINEIREGRANGTAGREDVLAMLLAARDDAGDVLSEEEIRDELVTLLVAGHETTATGLAWALRWIVPNAPLLVRLRAELDTATDNGELSPEKVARLELLDGCVKEALRLSPVVPMIGRVLQEPRRVLGHDLAAGTALAASIYLVHRRPDLYPNPGSFDPDRYRAWKPAPSEWLPFGGGIRRCIGAAFAIYEMKMVLAAILSRTELALAVAEVPTARRAITLTPKDGLPIRMLARRDRRRVAALSTDLADQIGAEARLERRAQLGALREKSGQRFFRPRHDAPFLDDVDVRARWLAGEEAHLAHELPLGEIADRPPFVGHADASVDDDHQTIERGAMGHQALVGGDRPPGADGEQLAELARRQGPEGELVDAVLVLGERDRSTLGEQAADLDDVDDREHDVPPHRRPDRRRREQLERHEKRAAEHRQHAQPENVLHQERRQKQHVRRVDQDLHGRLTRKAPRRAPPASPRRRRRPSARDRRASDRAIGRPPAPRDRRPARLPAGEDRPRPCPVRDPPRGLAA
jgi:cytochrome P450